TPVRPGREALVRGNVLVGNGSALALQSTAHLAFFGNRVSENLAPVRAEGARLSERNAWSRDGRGNFWGDYRGYDADRDGIGDLPHRYRSVMSWLAHRAPAVRAFALTPAETALDQAARMFPLVRPQPLLVDPHPLMSPPDVACADAGRVATTDPIGGAG
ncbi:MAG: hypothetical protein R3190_03600, partial [Thermoanaerobaculia bacterium]|nr:hypothetical protein [Thermoanaerobaculia bacterium]